MARSNGSLQIFDINGLDTWSKNVYPNMTNLDSKIVAAYEDIGGGALRAFVINREEKLLFTGSRKPIVIDISDRSSWNATSPLTLITKAIS